MKKLLLAPALGALLILSVFNSCKKQEEVIASPAQDEQAVLRTEAEKAVAANTSTVDLFTRQYGTSADPSAQARHNRNIVQVAQSLPIFNSLVAAVVKTGLAPTLSTPGLNATVFAPTDAAFAKLPAPFNNPANINGISDPAQIAALKNILLYHVLGSKVRRNQIAAGRSNTPTLKPVVVAGDNRVFLSNSLGLLLVNGNSLVLLANVDASNGIIHVIDDVLLPPSQTIAGIAIADANFSALVAALVKTNLAAVFAGAGDFTVFAPTNAAFAQLPAPFNNAANINAISDAGQIAALANILKYHVTGSRYFAWDLGIFNNITTIAAAPNNKLVGLLGLNNGYVKGNQNPSFATAHPANILATNGVIQVINKVLLP
jgi:uncharacterized surface protein with fasciclin (FAS1) repeats